MKSISIELKWSLTFFLMALAWMFLEYLTGLHDAHIHLHATLTNLFAIPAIAVYVLALNDKRRNFYNGNMTYKQGFVSGLIITLIVTALNPLSQYLISHFITPHYFANAVAYAVTEGKISGLERGKKPLSINSS